MTDEEQQAGGPQSPPELDPVAAGRMEPTNRRRVVRALEVTVGSGRPFSSYLPLSGAVKLKNGPTPFMLARSYGCLEPTASKL